MKKLCIDCPLLYIALSVLWLSIMIQSFPLLYFLVASRSLAIPINGRRNPQDNVYVQGPSDAVVLDLPSATAVSPPTATGGLYGSKDLLGYGGNPVSGNDIVEDPQIVPGQLADPIEGLAVCTYPIEFMTYSSPIPSRRFES